MYLNVLKCTIMSATGTGRVVFYNDPQQFYSNGRIYCERSCAPCASERRICSYVLFLQRVHYNYGRVGPKVPNLYSLQRYCPIFY